MALKKILVITDALTQPLYHARVRNVVQSLRDKNVNIDWITEKYETIPSTLNVEPIIQIPFYKHRGTLGKVEWLCKNILNVLFDYKNRYFTRHALKYVTDKEYDMVFCSTFHTFGLRAAHKIAKQKQIPLHIDLRDIAEQCANNAYSKALSSSSFNLISKLYRQLNIWRRNKILRKADSLSSVSPWHVAYLSQFNPNTHLIYNGYDEKRFYPTKVKSERFKIVYAGKWYGKPLQDPTLLFEALAEIDKPLIDIVWYTNAEMHAPLKQMASQYLENNHQLEVNSYVPNSEVATILANSSIILVLTNKGTHGIMTTKFFEALGVEKPILCIRSDEGYLAKTIQETKSGLAATRVEEVKDFILKAYAQWEQEGYTHVEVQQKEQFSRQNQALQFEEIFNNIIK